jgi:hypothetical protein
MEPHIISVSRREDIPAFRGDWFMEKIKKGYVNMVNPWSTYTISFEKVKLAVFWSKNPRPFMKYLDSLPFKYYFQFTLNGYPEYELEVPPILERIETFKELSDKIGRECVIWRFDPIIISDKITEEKLLRRIEKIGNEIHNYTEKLVFSYIDPYKKLGNKFKEVPDDVKIRISKQLIEFNKDWGLKLATCAESINLDGIEHNKCVDPELIERICGKQRWITSTKDKNQRTECGCIQSGDIGTFKTCKHHCTYCYAC